MSPHFHASLFALSAVPSCHQCGEMSQSAIDAELGKMERIKGSKEKLETILKLVEKHWTVETIGQTSPPVL